MYIYIYTCVMYVRYVCLPNPGFGSPRQKKKEGATPGEDSDRSHLPIGVSDWNGLFELYIYSYIYIVIYSYIYIYSYIVYLTTHCGMENHRNIRKKPKEHMDTPSEHIPQQKCGGFHWTILLKLGIFHCHVWLPFWYSGWCVKIGSQHQWW